jgi:hypothetical protein
VNTTPNPNATKNSSGLLVGPVLPLFELPVSVGMGVLVAVAMLAETKECCVGGGGYRGGRRGEEVGVLDAHSVSDARGSRVR